MKFAEVLYKCQCLKAERTVLVPERHATDAMPDWIGKVAEVVSADHRSYSVLCQATKMEYVKVKVLNGEILGKGDVSGSH